MANTSKTEPKRSREIYYYRQRLKNRVFSKLAAFFAEEAEKSGVSKKDIAILLNKDQAQITRWLSNPSNLTLETISDILLALNAELEPHIVKFSDRVPRNFTHPLIAKFIQSSMGQKNSGPAAVLFPTVGTTQTVFSAGNVIKSTSADQVPPITIQGSKY